MSKELSCQHIFFSENWLRQSNIMDIDVGLTQVRKMTIINALNYFLTGVQLFQTPSEYVQYSIKYWIPLIRPIFLYIFFLFSPCRWSDLSVSPSHWDQERHQGWLPAGQCGGQLLQGELFVWNWCHPRGTKHSLLWKRLILGVLINMSIFEALVFAKVTSTQIYLMPDITWTFSVKFSSNDYILLWKSCCVQSF